MGKRRRQQTLFVNVKQDITYSFRHTEPRNKNSIFLKISIYAFIHKPNERFFQTCFPSWKLYFDVTCRLSGFQLHSPPADLTPSLLCRTLIPWIESLRIQKEMGVREGVTVPFLTAFLQKTQYTSGWYWQATCFNGFVNEGGYNRFVCVCEHGAGDGGEGLFPFLSSIHQLTEIISISCLVHGM